MSFTPTIWVALTPEVLALLEQRAARLGKAPSLVAAEILTVHLRKREADDHTAAPFGYKAKFPPDARCATCGHEWCNHNYRHPFKPVPEPEDNLAIELGED